MFRSHSGCSKQLTCFVCACTGAQDQQAALQQKQKQLEESKQELAQLKEVAEPDRVWVYNACALVSCMAACAYLLREAAAGSDPAG